MRKVEQQIHGHVYGQVAGRDIHYVVQEAAVVPCSTCEYRVVIPGQKECNHCARKRETDELLNWFAVLALAFGLATWIGCLVAWSFGLEGREAIETGAAIGLLLLGALYFLYLLISAWIDLAATQEASDMRHTAAVLVCLIPGGVGLAAIKYVPEMLQSWVAGGGVLLLMFCGLLLRKKSGARNR